MSLLSSHHSHKLLTIMPSQRHILDFGDSDILAFVGRISGEVIAVLDNTVARARATPVIKESYVEYILPARLQVVILPYP